MRSNSRKIAFSGLSVALTVIALYFSSIFKFNTLTFLALTSLLTVCIVIECGYTFALLKYFASTILILILVPDKMVVLAYIAFFGWYAIIKSICEKLKNKIFEWIIKLVCFNISLFIIWYVSINVLGQIINKLPLWVIWLASNTLFIIFDFVLSYGINYYNGKIRKNIK